MRRIPRPHRFRPPGGAAVARAAAGAFLLCSGAAAGAQDSTATAAAAAPLADLSLEQLMNMEVSSVSRRQEPWFEATAAVDVVTGDDIRRSGATSIPEALRLVTGLQVARTNASQWAITARGFNNQFANKLLVLIDGRSVYTPLFAGVYWDVQDLPLEHIDRIEVIRGPGATLWGANAVNGVINIITKRASDMPRAAVTAAAGTAERGIVSTTFGGPAGDRGAYRVFLKHHDTAAFADSRGEPADDGWRVTRAGLRADFDTGGDLLTVQGDAYGGELGQVAVLFQPEPPYSLTVHRQAEVAGGFLLGRWSHLRSPRSRTALQMYYDGTYRNDPFLASTRHTADLDFQHDWEPRAGHQIVWGAGYRLTADWTRATFEARLLPPQRTDHLASCFAQDELAFAGRRVRLTLGTKLEHNSYTGVEVQPSVRMAWFPNGRTTVWGAVSRAVRTPSRVEDDAQVILFVQPAAGTDTLNLIALAGNRALRADRLVAFEAGTRWRASQRVTLDVAAYYDRYRGLGTFEPVPAVFETDPPPPHFITRVPIRNLGRGEAYGVEASTNLQLHRRWRVTGGAAWLRLDIGREPGSLDTNIEATEGSDPRVQFALRSRLDLPWNLECDAAWFHVGKLRYQAIPAYDRADVVLGWAATQRLRLQAVGQNLLEPRHPEFSSAGTTARATEVERGVYAKLSWRP